MSCEYLRSEKVVFAGIGHLCSISAHKFRVNMASGQVFAVKLSSFGQKNHFFRYNRAFLCIFAFA